MERAVMCPQCNAPLKPHPFARSVVCSYCGATVKLDEASVSAARFHQAFQAWNNPAADQMGASVAIGAGRWALEECIARGEIADVYTARRARWPTELVLVKLLRDPKDRELLDNEWKVLQTLQKSPAPGAQTFSALLPQLVIHGETGPGLQGGRRANVFRRASGFRYTFADVRQVYPGGIPPQASIWMWRRILEVLSFIHASGMAHGALVPAHILVQDGEHGARLVGYTRAGRFDAALRGVAEGDEVFYPKAAKSLTGQLDVVMSARTMAAMLGGKPETVSLPAAVPAKLADVITRVALSEKEQDAWALREELGAVAKESSARQSSFRS